MFPSTDNQGGRCHNRKLTINLISTFDGQLDLLKSVIENPLVNIYARGAALDVYGKLYLDEIVTKEECINYLRSLIYDVGYDFDIENDIATYIQGVVCDKHIFEMIDDIQYLYDQDRIDIGMYGKYDDFIDIIYSYEHNSNHVKYIESTIDEMAGWSCFEQTADMKRKEACKRYH